MSDDPFAMALKDTVLKNLHYMELVLSLNEWPPS